MSRTDARPAPSPPDATVACLDDEEAVAAAHAVVTSSCLTIAFAREIFPEQQFRITRTKQFKLLTRAPRAAPAGPRSVGAAGVDDSPVTVDDYSRATSSASSTAASASIAKRYARSLTLSINDEADRAVELYTFSFSYPSSSSITVAESRAQHVALDKALTFFATVLPETTSAAASFTLKMAFNSTAPAAAAGFARGDPRPTPSTRGRPELHQAHPRRRPGPARLRAHVPRRPAPRHRGGPVAESAPPASGCFDLKLSDSLKDDDETQLDSARISPPKKKRRRGPEDHPSYLSSGIPVCSQDSVISSRSYGDDAYLF
ncbi:hypothetical protein JL720_3096 [Aureococcus anophagefferens]|nr:hypothetical protein JL720_3096 [Aureococcus anophagefferens]